MRLAISQLTREPTFRSLGLCYPNSGQPPYAGTLILAYAGYAKSALPYTGYAHAILCWRCILAYSDSNSRTAPDRAGSPPGSPWRRPLVPLIARAPIPIA